MLEKNFPISAKSMLPGIYLCALFMVGGFLCLTLPLNMHLMTVSKGVILKSILGMGIWLSFFIGISKKAYTEDNHSPSGLLFGLSTAFCFMSGMCGIISWASSSAFIAHHLWPTFFSSYMVNTVYSMCPTLSCIFGLIGVCTILKFKHGK